MLSNNTKGAVHWLAGRFPGQIGHLYGPLAQRGPYPWIPYALDNNAFKSFKDGTEWNEAEWIALLDWAKLSGQKPQWVLVPDVVGDRLSTLRKWDKYAPIAAKYGWPLAFAAQDGMTPADMPKEASVAFIGGTTEWKWANFATWCDKVEHVHVGRVNEYRALKRCRKAGVRSVDGTGWMQEPDGRQWRGLVADLEEENGIKPKQENLELWNEELPCL